VVACPWKVCTSGGTAGGYAVACRGNRGAVRDGMRL